MIYTYTFSFINQVLISSSDLFSGWFFIKFNNTFVFQDPESPIINILYGWSGLYGQFLLCSVLFSLQGHQN